MARETHRGFTLIELLVAMAIAALLMLLGMPSFTTFVRNSEIRSTAESLINGLRAAKSEAASRNAQVHFELAGGGSADWTFWVYEDDQVTKDTIQTYSKKEAGANTSITTTPLTKLSVVFDGMGRVANQGVANDHIQQIDIAPQTSGEARPLRIIVDDPNPPAASKPRGIRMCDPDPALTTLSPPDPRAC